MYNDKIVVLYENKTKDILTTVTPNNTQFNIESFVQSRLQYDDKFRHFNRQDIGVSIVSKSEFDKNMGYNNSLINFCINPLTNEVDFNIQKREAIPNKNRTYADHEYKREYSLEQVYEMYNEDYINFNLRNAILNGILEARFIPIKDLNIRPRITQRTWKYFVNDPYLKDMHDDKLKLGRSILEIGTWYPFVVAPMTKDDDKLYVFEGNHRIISLKLLAMIGEISEDFKVMCLVLPTDYFTFKEKTNYTVLPFPVKYRYILEDVYGCDILVNQELLNKTLDKVKSDGEIFINDYTVEAVGTKMSDIIGVVHAYPLFLRDLIYLHDSKVLPSPIINNEEKFKEWINDGERFITHS